MTMGRRSPPRTGFRRPGYTTFFFFFLWILVMFGGRSANSRDAQMVKLLDQGFSKAVHSSRRAASRPPSSIKVRPRPKQRPAAVRGPTTTDHWGVQVGAFRSPGAANTMARAAATRLRAIAPGATISITPMRSQGIDLHRARVMGMTEENARRSCQRLKQIKFACVPVSPITGSVLAFNR